MWYARVAPMSVSYLRHRVPYPIASLFTSISGPAHNPVGQCWRVLRFLQGTVRFLALVNLADARSRSLADKKQQHWRKMLIDSNSFTEICKTLKDSSDFLRETEGGPFLREIVDSGSWLPSVTAVIGDRNWLAHASFAPDESDARELLSQLAEVKDVVGKALAWLVEYELGTVVAVDTDHDDWFEWRPAQGNASNGMTVRVPRRRDTPRPWTRGVMLRDPGGALLDLRPWLRWAMDDTEKDMVWLWRAAADELDSHGARGEMPKRKKSDKIDDTYIAFDGLEIRGVGKKVWRTSECETQGRIDLHLSHEALARFAPPPIVHGFDTRAAHARGRRSSTWIAETSRTPHVRVALKVAHPGHEHSLRREAQILESLRGEGTPRVIPTSECPGVTALATEWIDGSDLGRLNRADIDAAEILEIAHGLARVLARIHAAGVVHGRIERSNVLRTAYGILLVGFGESRIIDEDALAQPGDDVRAAGALIAELCDAPLDVPVKESTGTWIARVLDDRRRDRVGLPRIDAAVVDILARFVDTARTAPPRYHGGMLLNACAREGATAAPGVIRRALARIDRVGAKRALARAEHVFPTPVALAVAQIPDESPNHPPNTIARAAYYAFGHLLRYSVATGAALRQARSAVDALALFDRPSVPTDWFRIAVQLRPRLAPIGDLVKRMGEVGALLSAAIPDPDLDELACGLLGTILGEIDVWLASDRILIVAGAGRGGCIARGAAPARWTDARVDWKLDAGAYIQLKDAPVSLAPLARFLDAPQASGRAAHDLVLFGGRSGSSTRFLPALMTLPTVDDGDDDTTKQVRDALGAP